MGQSTAVATFPVKAGTPQALVFGCIDYRFREQVQNFVKNNLGIGDFDFKTDAGSVKQINQSPSPITDWILQNFHIAIEHHKVAEIILFVHFDCAAYGGNVALGEYNEQLFFLKNEMERALTTIRKKCPGVKVTGYIAALQADQVHILPVTV